jgi:nucleoside-diphosphate-sugar epimerase
MRFDVVVDFIVQRTEQAERDYRLFAGKTGQYILISSEAVYQRPPNYYRIDESTPLSNPKYPYACRKTACEGLLFQKYREQGFPLTIVRPAHTYDERNIPLDIVPGSDSTWQVLSRIRDGKPVLVAGDGNGLWTMTHCEDFAKGFAGLMGNYAAIGESVHITSDEALTWDGIYDRIGAALGMPVHKVHVASEFLASCWPDIEGPLVLDKASGICFDNSKIKRLVPGFRAEIRYDQGVRRCVDYILSHPDLQIPDEKLDRFYDKVIEAQEKALTFFQDAFYG